MSITTNVVAAARDVPYPHLGHILLTWHVRIIYHLIHGVPPRNFNCKVQASDAEMAINKAIAPIAAQMAEARFHHVGPERVVKDQTFYADILRNSRSEITAVSMPTVSDIVHFRRHVPKVRLTVRGLSPQWVFALLDLVTMPKLMKCKEVRLERAVDNGVPRHLITLTEGHSVKKYKYEHFKLVEICPDQLHLT